MEIDEIRKLAEAQADKQERRGTSMWQGLYYGFIFGYQACLKSNLEDKIIRLTKKLKE